VIHKVNEPYIRARLGTADGVLVATVSAALEEEEEELEEEEEEEEEEVPLAPSSWETQVSFRI